MCDSIRCAVVVALLGAGLAACGGSPVTQPSRIEVGVTGGNIRPHKAVITLTGDRESRVRAAFAGLTSRRCPGTLPDIATEYIRFEGRTVRVHGACEPAFTRLWNALSAARL